jgi:hypothetical protein
MIVRVNGPRLSQPRTARIPLSPDVLAGIAKLVDFCLVAIAAALSFVLYHRSLGQDLPEWDRYGLSAVLGALLFVIGFLNAGGYELSRLKNLRWQLMRTTTIWATVASALLFLAFLCKMSDMYSRGRAIAALGFLTLARGLLHGAISRWTRQGKRLGAGQRAARRDRHGREGAATRALRPRLHRQLVAVARCQDPADEFAGPVHPRERLLRGAVPAPPATQESRNGARHHGRRWRPGRSNFAQRR